MKLASSRGEYVIPYGTGSVSSSQLAAFKEPPLSEANLPGAPVVGIPCGSRAPLRLHDVTHPFARQPVSQDLAHGRDQVAFLEAHLAGLCGVWNKPLKRFIQGYFAAIRQHVQESASELEERLGQVAGLAELEHWVFAAPTPLPRAHIRLTASTESDRPDTGEFHTADVAFWDGAGLMCCFVSGGTMIGKQLRAVNALTESGIRVIRLSATDCNDQHILLDRLGAPFAKFSEGLCLPQSPFGSKGIPYPA